MKLLAFLPFAAAAATVPQSVSYDGHKVFRVPVTDDGSFLRSILDKLDVSIWQPPSKKGAFADIHVPPHSLAPFEQALEGHEVITMHQDLGESIRNEGTYQVYAPGAPNSTWFNSYHAYSDHLQWLNDLASQYSKNAKVITSGNTLQGNPITGLHLFGNSGGGKKPAVVFHGTVHAREWIASMVRRHHSPSIRLSIVTYTPFRLSSISSTSCSANTVLTIPLLHSWINTISICSLLST